MSECRHGESLYGRCVKCGMTWEEQGKVSEAREFKFEIGQRVKVASGINGAGTVRYRYVERTSRATYVVGYDGFEQAVYEIHLSPVPLRHGDVVEREQADSIPAGTVVRDSDDTDDVRARVFLRTTAPYWWAFGYVDMETDGSLSWPVTVEIPAGDDE